MPPPMLWLVASLVSVFVAAACGYYYRNHKDEGTPMVTGTKTGMYIACLVACIMMGGYVYANRQAAKASANASSGMPQVDTTAPESVQALQKLQIANLQAASAIRAKGNAEAAALEAQSTRASQLLNKAQNLRKAGAI